jgi:hypothetical protein
MERWTDVVQRSYAAEDVVAAPGRAFARWRGCRGLLDDTDLPADPVFIAADLASSSVEKKPQVLHDRR